MGKILLVGDSESTRKYIEQYVESEGFLPYDVTVFEEQIKIEHVRDIVHQLSFKNSVKKLLIFNCELTPASQNGLLKSVEEVDMLMHFIFVVKSEFELLPTLQSRCIIVRCPPLISEVDVKMVELVEKVISSKLPQWDQITELASLLQEKNVQELLHSLRSLFLEKYNTDNGAQYYFYCKKLLKLGSLVENNNVSKSIVLERVFVPSFFDKLPLDKTFSI